MVKKFVRLQTVILDAHACVTGGDKFGFKVGYRGRAQGSSSHNGAQCWAERQRLCYRPVSWCAGAAEAGQNLILRPCMWLTAVFMGMELSAAAAAAKHADLQGLKWKEMTHPAALNNIYNSF